MSKLSTLAVITAALSLAAAATAQAAPTIGSGDSGNCYPFVCNDSGTDVGQTIDFYQIYDAAAFSGAFSFDTLSFRAWGPNPAIEALSGDYVISFGTTGTPLGGAYPIGPINNEEVFFSGSLSDPLVAGWLSIAGSSISYDPSAGNLVMRVVASNQALRPNDGSTGYLLADYTGVVTTRAYSITGATGPEWGAGGLVTTFGPGVPEPATWAVMIGGFGLVGFSLRRRAATTVAA